MGYYVELRPRDANPISLESYKERFAKILARHPATTSPNESQETRAKFKDDFMHPGGILSVYASAKVPAGVTADARFSWGDNAEQFRHLLKMLVGIAEQVSADLYIGDLRIGHGEEEKIVNEYRFGSVDGIEQYKQDGGRVGLGFSSLYQFKLGMCRTRSEGVEKDLAVVFKWFLKEAAQDDYIEAHFVVGCCYDNGCGIEKNRGEAAKWYRKASEQGESMAQNNLGILYQAGDGVEKDCLEAIKWFTKSAEQNTKAAQMNLAETYYQGKGVEKNMTEALKWCRKAAENSSFEAMVLLADWYYNGDGVEKDIALSKDWLVKAYRTADKIGKSKVREIFRIRGWADDELANYDAMIKDLLG